MGKEARSKAGWMLAAVVVLVVVVALAVWLWGFGGYEQLGGGYAPPIDDEMQAIMDKAKQDPSSLTADEKAKAAQWQAVAGHFSVLKTDPDAATKAALDKSFLSGASSLTADEQALVDKYNAAVSAQMIANAKLFRSKIKKSKPKHKTGCLTSCHNKYRAVKDLPKLAKCLAGCAKKL